MIFKQRLFTILLGLLFATVLTDQASALYDPGVGRFCSRDPIGYADGFGPYFVYFVPFGTDPTGEKFIDPHSPTTESECLDWYNNSVKECHTIPWYRIWEWHECMQAKKDAYDRCIKRVTDTPTTLLNYGYYCGPNRRASCDDTGKPIWPNDKKPKDDLDLACAEHDCCLPTVVSWCDQVNHNKCNTDFCNKLSNMDCSSAEDPLTCERYVNRAWALTCGTLGGPIHLP